MCGSSTTIETQPYQNTENDRLSREAMNQYLAFQQREANLASSMRESEINSSGDYTATYSTQTTPVSFQRAEGGWREITKEEADTAKLAGYGRYIREPQAPVVGARDSQGRIIPTVAGAATGSGDGKYYMEGTMTPASSSRVVSGFNLTDAGRTRRDNLRTLSDQAMEAQAKNMAANTAGIELQNKNLEVSSALFPILVKEQLGLEMVQDPTTKAYTFNVIEDSVQAKQKEVTLLALERTRKALLGELDVPKDLELHWNQEQVNFEESMRKQWGSSWQEAATEQLTKFQTAKAASLDAARRGELVTASNIAMQVKPVYTTAGLPSAQVNNPFSIASPSAAQDYSANLTNQWRNASPNYDYFVNAAQGYQLPAQNLSAYQNYTGNVAIANAQNASAQQQGFGQLLGTLIGTGVGAFGAMRKG